jgi:diguanylate cyclase (GGDEF)-like protein/PAS domain S-box-containing protein
MELAAPRWVVMTTPRPSARLERRLQLYLDTAGVVLLLLDRSGRVAEINRTGAEVLGFPVAELLGRDWFATCVPAADRLQARAETMQGLTGGFAAADGEGRVVSRDGSLRTIAWRYSVLFDDRGEPSGIVCAGEDVTERRAAADVLGRLAASARADCGGSFLHSLVQEMVSALGAARALVGEADELAERLHVVASWPHDDFLDSFALPLDGSPLAPTLGGDLRTVAEGACRRYPGDPLLERYRVDGLLALSLRDRNGQLLGVLAVLHEGPFAALDVVEPVVRLFGARAAAELERRRTEEALDAARDLAEVTLQSIGDAVITTDPAGTVTSLNQAAERLLACSREEALGQPVDDILRLVDERSGEPLPSPVEHCFREGGPVALPEGTVLLAKDGERRAVSDTAAPIRDRDGSVRGAVVVFQDVTEARRMATTIAYRAAHDTLTGLLNRGELERRLEEARLDAASRGAEHALCYLDLDQFKVVNDLCGHAAGDELLRRLAQLLRRQVRASDVLARLGGDEFGLLLEGCPLDRAQELAEAVCKTVREFRFTWEGRVFELGASVGVVPVTASAESSAWLLSRADVACYAAKDRGRNRVFVDREGDPELVRRQMEMSRLSDLLAGLEQGRFCLVFQPIVPLAAGAAAEIRGEVLLRWIDDQGRQVSAGAFIPAAERYNLMATVDTWVMRETLRFFGERLAAGGAISSVSINLSSNTLSDQGFADRVRRALEETAFPPARVWFEITETAAVNNLGQAVELMERLRAYGCRFALDDFGSGLSSFRLLRNLPIDALKIDGSFVRDMETDPVDLAVVEATTRVARAMGLTTVAEWVEDPGLLGRLRELGIDYAQGWAVGRPVPLSAMGRSVLLQA